MKIAFFIAVGAFLIFVDWWYIRTMYRTYCFSSQVPDVVAPFRFVGSTDGDGSKGQSMAVMLSARLGSLQHEFGAAFHALRSANKPDDKPPQRGGTKQVAKVETKDDTPGVGEHDREVIEQERRELHEAASQKVRNTPSLLVQPEEASPIELKSRVIEIPRLELKVSGVDFSGLFAWAYRTVAEGRAIRVTVNCPAGATTYEAAVDLETDEFSEIWLTDIPANDVSVVNEVALAILQLQSIKTKAIPEAAGLDRGEFGKLIGALRQIGELNEKVQSKAVPTNAEYTKVVVDLETILTRTPQWLDLVELTAGAAENSRDLAKALGLYERAKELVDSANQDRKDELTKNVSRLRGQLKTVSEFTRINKLLKVPTGVVGDRRPRVGVLGGIPLPEQLSSLGKDVEKLDEEASTEANRAMREHVGAVASVISMVVPNATLVFASMKSESGMAVDSSVLKSLDQFADANVDVLVIPLGLDTPDSSAMVTAIKRIGRKSVVVLPAGNDEKAHDAQFAGIIPRDEVMVVGAVDRDGKRASFSSGKDGDPILWAPGVNIPVRVWSHGGVADQLQNGTSYAAGIGGAAAAIVVTKHLDSDPKKIIKALQDTSEAAEQGGPRLIQVEKALEKLSEPQATIQSGA